MVIFQFVMLTYQRVYCIPKVWLIPPLILKFHQSIPRFWSIKWWVKSMMFATEKIPSWFQNPSFMLAFKIPVICKSLAIFFEELPREVVRTLGCSSHWRHVLRSGGCSVPMSSWQLEVYNWGISVYPRDGWSTTVVTAIYCTFELVAGMFDLCIMLLSYCSWNK